MPPFLEGSSLEPPQLMLLQLPSDFIPVSHLPGSELLAVNPAWNPVSGAYADSLPFNLCLFSTNTVLLHLLNQKHFECLRLKNTLSFSHPLSTRHCNTINTMNYQYAKQPIC
jgi:hypothetical protein